MRIRLAACFALWLGFGVIVSYLVAWFFAARMELPRDLLSNPKLSVAAQTAPPKQWWAPMPQWPGLWEEVEARGWAEPAATRESGFGVTVWRVIAFKRPDNYVMREVGFGWPFRSVSTIWTREQNLFGTSGTTLEILPHPSVWHGGWRAYEVKVTDPLRAGEKYEVHLPLRPLVGGLLLNAMLIGGVGFVLVNVLPIWRRYIARKRGLCEKCRYPRGASMVCTECGEKFEVASGSV
jgi:hypothetical protein